MKKAAQKAIRVSDQFFKSSRLFFLRFSPRFFCRVSWGVAQHGTHRFRSNTGHNPVETRYGLNRRGQEMDDKA